MFYRTIFALLLTAASFFPTLATRAEGDSEYDPTPICLPCPTRK